MSNAKMWNVTKRVDIIFSFMAVLLFQCDSVTLGEFRREFWTSYSDIM